MALADVTFEGIAWPRQSFQIKCEGILIDIISMTAHDSWSELACLSRAWRWYTPMQDKTGEEQTKLRKKEM